MHKLMRAKTEFKVSVNAYFIRDFRWVHEIPDDHNSILLTVTYDLATQADDGSLTPSTLPDHRGIQLALFNIGEDKRLTRFLEASGTDKKDLWDFNYHDLERLVEADILSRFGLKV